MTADRRAAITGAVAVALAFAAGLAHPDVSGNPASRFATVESLVERGTWAIDDSTFARGTVDKVTVDGRTYSSKPPLFPLAGAAAYGAWHATTGLTFSSAPIASRTVVRLALVVAPFALFLLALWRFLREWMRDERARVWLFSTVALASYLFGYASKLNNHAPAAFLVFAAFVLAWSAAHRDASWRTHALAGLACGVAIALDLGAAPSAAAIGVYLLCASPRRALLAFAPAALPPLVASSVIVEHITGSPLPIYLQHHLYHAPGSYWLAPASYDALREPTLVYLFHMTLGHHGWLAMAPVLVFAPLGVRALWTGGRRAEALVLAVPAAFTFTFYALYTHNYGGSCGGMRWLVVTAPLWFLAVGRWLDDAIARPGPRRAYVACAIVGAVHALAMVWDPWTRSPWERLLTAIGLGSV